MVLLNIIDKIIHLTNDEQNWIGKNDEKHADYEFQLKNFYIENDKLIFKIHYSLNIYNWNNGYLATAIKGSFLFKKNYKTGKTSFGDSQEKFFRCLGIDFYSLLAQSNNEVEFKEVIFEHFINSNDVCLEHFDLLIENPKLAFKIGSPEVSFLEHYNLFRIYFKFNFDLINVNHFVNFTVRVNFSETDEEIKIVNICLEKFDSLRYESILQVIPNLEEAKNVFLSNLLLKKVFTKNKRL